MYLCNDYFHKNCGTKPFSMNLKQCSDYNQIQAGRHSSHLLECTAAPNSRLPKITISTAQTNITHKVCGLIVYFLLHVLFIQVDHHQ